MLCYVSVHLYIYNIYIYIHQTDYWKFYWKFAHTKIGGGSPNMQTVSWLAGGDPAASDKPGWVREVSGRVCKSLSWESRTIMNHHFWWSFAFVQEREPVEVAMTTGCQSSLNGVSEKRRVIPKSAVGQRSVNSIVWGGDKEKWWTILASW